MATKKGKWLLHLGRRNVKYSHSKGWDMSKVCRNAEMVQLWPMKAVPSTTFRNYFTSQHNSLSPCHIISSSMGTWLLLTLSTYCFEQNQSLLCIVFPIFHLPIVYKVSRYRHLLFFLLGPWSALSGKSYISALESLQLLSCSGCHFPVVC